MQWGSASVIIQMHMMTFCLSSLDRKVVPSKRTCSRSLSQMLKDIFHHSLAQQIFLESPQSARDKVTPREGAVRETQMWP